MAPTPFVQSRRSGGGGDGGMGSCCSGGGDDQGVAPPPGVHGALPPGTAAPHRYVRAGVADVLRAQRLRSAWLDSLLAFQAWWGEEDAYALVVPLMFWHGLYGLARHLLIVQCIGVVLCNSVKAVCRQPRPALLDTRVWCPSLERRSRARMWEAQRWAGTPRGGARCATADAAGRERAELLRRYADEWGFPSTHTLNAVANGGVVVWALHGAGAIGGGAPAAAAAAAVAAWAALLGFGRVYLGQHTPVDVAGGAAIGAAWGAAYVTASQLCWDCVAALPLWAALVGPLAALAAGCRAVRLGGGALRPTDAMILDSTAFLALAAGDVIAVRLYGDLLAGSERPIPIATAAALTVASTVVVCAAKLLLKPATLFVLRPFCSPDSLTAKQAAKCVCYLSIVCNVAAFLPLAWAQWGLSVQPPILR